MLVPNLAVKGQVSDLVVFCRYGLMRGEGDDWVPDPNGCQDKLRFGDHASHEQACAFRMVVCPNAATCGPLRARELEAHLASCAAVACPNTSIGCRVRGTRAEITEHALACKFEVMRDVMAGSEERFAELRGLLSRKDNEISLLTQTLIGLSQKLDNLASNIEFKLDSYDIQLSKMSIALEDTRRQVGLSLDELSAVKQRIGAADDAQMYHHLYRCQGTVSGHTGPVWTLTCSDSLLFSGSSDESIRIWSPVTLQCLNVLEGHRGIVHALVFYRGAQQDLLISASSDCTVRVWETSGRFSCLRTLSAGENTVFSLALAGHIAFAGSLKEIRAFSLETFEPVHVLSGHNHWVRALTVHDGVLYSGSYNQVLCWDAASFACLRTVTCTGGSIYSLAVHGSMLCVGTYENNVLVYSRESYALLHTLTGHIGTVYSVIVIPGYIVSASYDNSIKLWNSETLACVQTLVRHTSSVDALCFTHSKLFSASADNSIKVWV